jgi:putative ABC transport system ATP-binding protein
MSENAVEVERVTKIYKMGKLEVGALNGVSLKVRKGDFTAFIGPSGSGKTTLLNIIGGLDKPTSGFVKIEGREITKLNRNRLAEIRRVKVGFVFQFFNLIPTLTAAENIEIPMTIARASREKRKRRVQELLEVVGLSTRATHKPSELSGGEQQRVAIARAISNEPAVVLADEPTGNLDSKTASGIINLLNMLSQTRKQTIIVATHDPLLAKVAKNTVLLKDGRISS